MYAMLIVYLFLKKMSTPKHTKNSREEISDGRNYALLFWGQSRGVFLNREDFQKYPFTIQYLASP